MDGVSKRLYGQQETVRQFPRPGPLSLWLSQLIWIPFGLRFNCFTMAAVKRG